MNDLLFNVLQAVVVLVIGAVGRYFIPWIKEKITNTKLEAVFTWVIKFVEAAEQTMTEGTDKKIYVTEKLKELLATKKLTLTANQIEALVEATVNELFPSAKRATM